MRDQERKGRKQTVNTTQEESEVRREGKKKSQKLSPD